MGGEFRGSFDVFFCWCVEVQDDEEDYKMFTYRHQIERRFIKQMLSSMRFLCVCSSKATLGGLECICQSLQIFVDLFL